VASDLIGILPFNQTEEAMNQSASQIIAQSRRAGRELAAAFADGSQPRAVSARVALYPGEFCAGVTTARILQWLGSEGEYYKKSGGYMFGGGGVGVAYNAFRLTSNLVGNKARKAKAAREAAFKWRAVEQGNVFLTNRRFCIQGGSQWIDLWHSEIRMAHCNGEAIELEISERPRTALQMCLADYWFVMFNKLAYDRILLPPAANGQAYQELTEGMQAVSQAASGSE
jgi:hypothetical protein